MGLHGEVVFGTPSAESVVVSVAVSEAELFKLPAVGARVTVPLIGVVPFKNCTGVARAPPGATPLLSVDTVAVSVTLPPDTMLVELAVTVVVVTACVIVTVSVGDVLPRKLLSPAYVATSGCDPARSWTG